MSREPRAAERPTSPPQREFGEPRGEGAEPDGEGRPRRRRGRRGGRGRGRGRGQGQREETAAPARLGDDATPHREDLGSEPLDELVDERRAPGSEQADRPLDEEGRPRRRRRRRGRRGGRRGATAGEPGGDAVVRREPGDHHDDEPLPAGYGRSQQVRQPESREPAGRTEQGERRGRRRRRGRGDESGRRPAAADSGAESSPRRGRRGRRDADRDRTSSSSSLARRSRDDFAPVSRGYDEDDEGLEFLGVEDVVHDQPRREQRHTDDDVIAESGLDAVRDVPSWVEAIGIVIAGNLDARSRPRSDRGDDDRRRR